jgi:hypothetical protein
MSSPDLDQETLARDVTASIDGHLRAGKVCSFKVFTSSMWPAILPGESIKVGSPLLAKLHVGEILVRQVEGSWIAHRLIGWSARGTETLLVTKGDNALTSDTWPATQLVGVVVGVTRTGGRQTASLSLETRSRAFLIALMSRGQLIANQIEPQICRRLAVKTMRACLRMVAFHWVKN